MRDEDRSEAVEKGHTQNRPKQRRRKVMRVENNVDLSGGLTVRHFLVRASCQNSFLQWTTTTKNWPSAVGRAAIGLGVTVRRSGKR